MAAFTITSLDDTAGDTGLGLEIGGTGSRRGTLRQAINFANLDGVGPDAVTTITVASGLVGTVTLAEDLPPVATSTTLDGGGLTLDGRGRYGGIRISGRAANSRDGATTTMVGIANLTIRNARAQDEAVASAGSRGGNGGDLGGTPPREPEAGAQPSGEGAAAVGGREPGDSPEVDADPQQPLTPYDGVPPGFQGPEAWQAYREQLAHIYEVSLPDPEDARSFHVTSTAYLIPQAALIRTASAAQILDRTPRLIEGSLDQIMIYLQVAGTLESNCDGRISRLGPGDVALFDYGRPIRSRVSDFTNLVLSVERDILPRSLLDPALHGQVFSGTQGVGRILYAAVEALFAAAEHLRPAEGEAAVRSVLHLADGLVRARARADTAGPSAIDRARYAAALAYIDEHHGNPLLAPDEIAERTAVSRASLYRAFKTEGGVQAVLLRRRLDLALLDLLINREARSTLGNLARRHGFGGISQFGRAFRTRFGLSPRAYCALIEKQGADWHAQQLARLGYTRTEAGEAPERL